MSRNRHHSLPVSTVLARRGDKISGYLEVGTNDHGEVVINHPDLQPDENGVGHIVFSPRQARALAILLLTKASDAELELERSPHA